MSGLQIPISYTVGLQIRPNRLQIRPNIRPNRAGLKNVKHGKVFVKESINDTKNV